MAARAWSLVKHQYERTEGPYLARAWHWRAGPDRITGRYSVRRMPGAFLLWSGECQDIGAAMAAAEHWIADLRRAEP